ncbi:MAG: L,D-transpeptidase family protein [Pseudomonadota bacterium]
MMRPRTIVLTVATILVAGVAALASWDFFKFSRTAPPQAAPDARATLILVEKQVRRLSLVRNGQVLKTYNVTLGTHPVGHKQQEGDQRTPEGTYAIDFKHPRSRFHLALRVSYPNAEDSKQAQQRGIQAGGDIMIHGLPNGLGMLGRLMQSRDWTDGCIAVTNREIEEIWAMVDVGTPIQIKP